MSRIAVIGAGPAGLTAGYRLRAAGHEVTVFEERDVAGRPDPLRALRAWTLVGHGCRLAGRVLPADAHPVR